MRIVLFCILLITSVCCHGQSGAVMTIVERMINANNTLRSAKFTMYGEERLIGGKIAVTNRLVKIKVNPKQIYFYSVTPDPGTEILWKDHKEDDKMLVSPGGFPYVTFSLSYNSAVARKDSHHAICDLGFDYAVSMIEHYVKTYGNVLFKYITIKDTVQWDNRSCIHVLLDYKDFNYFKYTVKQNENISDIAKRYYVNDYLILTLNPSVGSFDDVKAGQVISVPNFYSNKIEFYIDRATWLPVKQNIFDQTGVYERYEFRSLIVNPNFSPEEFTRDYKDYKF